MDYNNMDAPNFVDFGNEDFDEDTAGDSWFSHHSIDDENTDVFGEEEESGIDANPLPMDQTSSATSSTTTLSAGPSATSATTLAESSSKLCSSRAEFAQQGARPKERIESASTPPSKGHTEILRNRRRSVRKGSAIRVARKASLRARERLMTPKRVAVPKTVTDVSPFQLATETRAKRVREASPVKVSEDPATKVPRRKVPTHRSVSSRFNQPTAASSASREAFESQAEKQAKFFAKTPLRFRQKPASRLKKEEKNPKVKDQIARTILDPTLFQGPKKLPAKRKTTATVPKSPAFALKNRKRRVFHADETETEADKKPSGKNVLFGGMKMPTKTSTTTSDPSMKSALKSDASKATDSGAAPRKRVTIPQPFECESRSKEMLEHKEKLIQKSMMEEKKKREFHAQPLPNLKDGLPEKKPNPSTKPHPFPLKTDERGHLKEKDFKQRTMAEELALKKAAEFKAQEAKVLETAPFAPILGRKPLTEFQEFHLATNDRAEVWDENDSRRTEREAKQRAEEEEFNRQHKLVEEEEIRKMREAMVHKAQPVPNYKVLQIQPSGKPLTLPESPDWSYKSKENDRSVSSNQ